MNERINALYNQAHIEHRQEYFSSVVDPTIKSVSVTRHFNPELFAELIIKECQHTVDRYIGECCEISSLPEKVLKKHFGIE